MKINNNDTSTMGTENRFYTDIQLKEIIKFEGSINELTSQYPTYYFRTVDAFYRAVYYSEYSAAVLLFDLEGRIISKRIYELCQSKDAYDSLSIGHSLDEVKTIDPKGEYLFLNTGRDDTPRISTHYTIDKYIIVITYSSDYLITDINIELV